MANLMLSMVEIDGGIIFALILLGLMALVFLGACLGVLLKIIVQWPNYSIAGKIHNIVLFILSLSMLNMLVGIFIVEVFFIGGTALNGKIDSGKYYVGEHGVYTEVSKSTYQLLLSYEKTTLLALFASLAILLLTYFFLKSPSESIVKTGLSINKKIMK